MNSPEKIITLEKACPICRSDVKGSDKMKYLCKKCNLLFDRDHLLMTKDEIKGLAEEKFREKRQSYEARIKPQISPPPEPKSVGKMTDKELREKFIVSLKSSKYHAINCPYIRRIKRDNLFYFDTEKDAKSKDYKPCVCRRLALKKDMKFVRSANSEEYHSTNCPWARNIKLENRIYFNDKKKAFGLKKHSCLMEQV